MLSHSNKSPFPRFFVSGTDTNVGKTVVSAVLCEGLNASYWKPIQAGKSFPTDSQCMAAWFGPERVLAERHLLTHPRSPNQAAQRDGARIDLAHFRLPELAEPLVVEGAGGLFVPLNRRHYMIDLIAALGLPVVLAARSGLGTLNHTLMSLEHLRLRQIPVAGLVLVGPPHEDNRRDLLEFGKVPLIGELPPLELLGREAFRRCFENWTLPLPG